MKISEFIQEYDSCPICGGVLDCVMYFELTHTISYKKIANVKDGCRFLQVAEMSASKYQPTLPHKTCVDCSKMPQFFDVKDRFNLPEGLVDNNRFPAFINLKKHGPQTGFSFIKIECVRRDFSRFSTEFNIFSDNHDIKIFDESFDVAPNKTIINDYIDNLTIIRTTNSHRTINLIPLSKWQFDDKAKMLEKFNKLLVLM